MNRKDIILKARERLYNVNPDPNENPSFLVPVDKPIVFKSEPPKDFNNTYFYTVRFDYDFVIGAWVFRYIEYD